MKIFNSDIAVTKFYRNNKDIISISEEEFKAWIVNNYLANHISDKFIATQKAIENGYMVNKFSLGSDIDFIKMYCNYRGYITPKGQKYILTLFQNKNKEAK